MEIINIHKAKSTLSSLIERALKGEKIVIAKNGKPVVTLEKIKKNSSKRVGGQFKGKIKISKDFDTLSEEFMSHFK
jgi:prevent-host-death family protein